ncbi:hypothetical protein GOODEAATRI_028865, partial [Goodea atripinnis]
ALLDMLQRTGVKGYTAFLESLELDYPQLYSRITGKEPNKTFSILIDTAGESGLTQFLMSELSRLQRVLQDERRRRQQACSVAKEQLNEELKQLRDHNYSLMADINTLNQEKSNALLANRDLQIESVEEKEELTLRSAQLKGDAKMYRQQNKQMVRQLEEVIRERDKVRRSSRKKEEREQEDEDVSNWELGLVFQALLSQAQQQEEVRLHLQEKDQFRKHVRQLTEKSDKLELLLLRSQGEELQLRTRLRKMTFNSQQVREKKHRDDSSNDDVMRNFLQ